MTPGRQTKVLAYIRVSTEEQSVSGLGLGAQRARIDSECSSRGWELVDVFEDRAASGKSLKGRPGLAAALTVLKGGEAEALIVSKLDRLSRSLLDFAATMERARSEGWALVALDLGVDTTTPSGEMMANVLASFAQYERRLIGQRTKDALDELRRTGVKLGRPRSLPLPVLKTIVRDRGRGATLTQIANDLNQRGVPTARGGARWYPSTIQKVLSTAEAKELLK